MASGTPSSWRQSSRGQVGQPDAVWIRRRIGAVAEQELRDFECQTRLANPAGADDRHKPGFRQVGLQQLTQRGERVAPPDEAREGDRQIVRTRARRGRGLSRACELLPLGAGQAQHVREAAHRVRVRRGASTALQTRDGIFAQPPAATASAT
jgi:hypothetical protein